MTVDELKVLAQPYIPEDATAQWREFDDGLCLTFTTRLDRRQMLARAFTEVESIHEGAAAAALEDMRDKWARELPERLAATA